MSELYQPNRGAFFAIAARRARLSRDITEFLAHKECQTEVEAMSLVNRGKEHYGDLRNWFHMWAADLASRSSLPSALPSLFVSLYGYTLELISISDINVFVTFNNSVCFINCDILALEHSQARIDECKERALEVRRAMEFLTTMDESSKCHAGAALLTAKVTIGMMELWSKEAVTRMDSEQQGGKYLDFNLWLKYMHSKGRTTGYREE
jgi:hypothetical protein